MADMQVYIIKDERDFRSLMMHLNSTSIRWADGNYPLDGTFEENNLAIVVRDKKMYALPIELLFGSYIPRDTSIKIEMYPWTTRAHDDYEVVTIEEILDMDWYNLYVRIHHKKTSNHPDFFPFTSIDTLLLELSCAFSEEVFEDILKTGRFHIKQDPTIIPLGDAAKQKFLKKWD